MKFYLQKFLEDQEKKRAEQLKSYDIEEADIDTTHLVASTKKANPKPKPKPPIIPGKALK